MPCCGRYAREVTRSRSMYGLEQRVELVGALQPNGLNFEAALVIGWRHRLRLRFASR